MKRFLIITASALILLSLCACGEEKAETANPWQDFESMYEAEATAGFEFSLPAKLENGFKALSFRVMDKKLLEIKYSDGDFEVILRKCSGEGEDISGVYEDFPNEESREGEGWTNTVKYGGGPVLYLISAKGCSYSIYAPKGFPGDTAQDFLRCILP